VDVSKKGRKMILFIPERTFYERNKKTMKRPNSKMMHRKVIRTKTAEGESKNCSLAYRSYSKQLYDIFSDVRSLLF
jgi:hypothetical protein